ncbi:hypothetical protein LEMLEM_LOCUS19748 [Lemmus lemmus]
MSVFALGHDIVFNGHACLGSLTRDSVQHRVFIRDGASAIQQQST